MIRWSFVMLTQQPSSHIRCSIHTRYSNTKYNNYFNLTVSFQKIQSQCDADVAFSADDSQIAVFFVIVCDIMHPVNLSFYPWPKGRSVRRWKVAFWTCNHLVICAKLKGDDSDEISGLLQVLIHNLIRIYNIADRAAKHRNVTLGYMLILWGTRDGWFMG